MQNNDQAIQLTTRVFYICVAVTLLVFSLLIAILVGGIKNVRAIEGYDAWHKNVYQRKYNEAVQEHLAKPTPKPKTARVTAYSCGGIETEAQRKMNCPNGISASGGALVPYKTMACDRANMGRKFYLEGIGEVTCNDTGGAIKGAGRFDLYVTDIQTARQWGNKKITYYLVEE